MTKADILNPNEEVEKTLQGNKWFCKKEKLFEYINNLEKEAFTGSIEVHFSQGGISKKIRHEVV